METIQISLGGACWIFAFCLFFFSGAVVLFCVILKLYLLGQAERLRTVERLTRMQEEVCKRTTNTNTIVNGNDNTTGKKKAPRE